MTNLGPISDKISSLLHGADYNPDQWLEMPEILCEDVRLMKLAHCNVATIGIFSWTALEPREGRYDFDWLDRVMDRMAENGVSVILATPSGAKPAWMAKAYPEVLRVDETGHRYRYGERHNHCPTSPVYRRKIGEMNRALAERYKDHPALILWHVSNEFEGECHCELCQEAFRAWLREKYHNSLRELNRAWYCSFWSHTYTDWEEISSPSAMGEQNLHGLNLDWRRFVTHQTADYCAHEIRALREAAPGIPVTTNFHDFVSPMELDYWKLAPLLDVVSWDNYPYWHSGNGDFDEGSRRAFLHDLNRSLKGGRPFLLMESSPSATNWQPVAKLRRPGMHRVQSLQAVAHGSDSVQYFQWRQSRGSSEKFHGAVVSHCGHENTRVFREAAGVGETLSLLPELVGTSVEPEAAVLFDWENAWAIRDAQGPRAQGKDYWETCQKHYKALWQNQIPMDVINEDCDFSRYKLLVAPMLYMVREGVGERLKSFVESGGILVTTYWSGIADENDLCFLGGFPGPLREICGIWSEELDALYDGETRRVTIECDSPLDLYGEYEAEQLCDLVHTEGAQVLGVYAEDFYRGMPALTYHRLGTGGAYYIAFRSGEEFLQDFYGALLQKLRLRPAVKFPIPYGISAQTRYDEKNTFVFLLNFTDEEKLVELPRGKYQDAETGEGLEQVLFDGYGARVLKELSQAKGRSSQNP